MDSSNYKIYVSAMRSTMSGIDASIKEVTITGWMQDISTIFPYYRHTNPQTMAIAMYMAQKNRDTFDKVEALNLVRRTSFNYTGKKNTNHIVIDVARYWKRLTSQ